MNKVICEIKNCRSCNRSYKFPYKIDHTSYGAAMALNPYAVEYFSLGLCKSCATHIFELFHGPDKAKA